MAICITNHEPPARLVLFGSPRRLLVHITVQRKESAGGGAEDVLLRYNGLNDRAVKRNTVPVSMKTAHLQSCNSVWVPRTEEKWNILAGDYVCICICCTRLGVSDSATPHTGGPAGLLQLSCSRDPLASSTFCEFSFPNGGGF
jgi:hypothetical protein